MIAHMEREFASSKIPTKSFMEISSMDSLKDKVNYTFLQEIIMWVSLSLIRNKVEVFTDGLAKSRTFMKVSLKEVKEMEEEHSGGQMAAGTKETSKMAYNVVLVHYIARVALANMKVFGRMACLTVRVSNTLTMDKDMKDTLSKINSMVRVYSTKMTQLFMVYGKIMSYQS